MKGQGRREGKRVLLGGREWLYENDWRRAWGRDGKGEGRRVMGGECEGEKRREGSIERRECKKEGKVFIVKRHKKSREGRGKREEWTPIGR